MSERDARLLRTIGLTYSDVAQLVSNSRQTVSKGINSEEDYFGPDRLFRIHEAKCGDDPSICALVESAIESIYPEHAYFIRGPEQTLFQKNENEGVTEYFFVCSNLAEFLANYELCSKSVNELLACGNSRVVIFVSEHDLKIARKHIAQFAMNGVDGNSRNTEGVSEGRNYVFVCELDLGIAPPMLIENRGSDASLFVAGMKGFSMAAPHDAKRIIAMLGVYRSQ